MTSLSQTLGPPAQSAPETGRHDADLRPLLGDDRHADIKATCFAYANRTVLGLGITTTGDDLGTAPPESDAVTE
ncbi:MAG: hypothetical protein ABIQ53_14245 [Terracoccus sp.]